MVKLNNKTVLEITKNEKVYTLECNSESPLGELHDVIVEFWSYIVQRIQDANDQQKKTMTKSEDVEIEAEPI